MLKQDGLVVILVPNIDSLEVKMLKERNLLWDIPRHLYDFSPHTLREMLKRAGFMVEKVVYFPRLDMFRWSLNTLLEEKGYRIRMGSRWLLNPLTKLIARLLSLCHLSGVITFYARKNAGDKKI